MKKLVKLLAVALVGAFAVMAFAACGSAIGGIKSKFEGADWTWKEVGKIESESAGSITVYYTNKGLITFDHALIFEAKAGTDFAKAMSEMKDDEDLDVVYRDIIKAVETAGKTPVVNENCAIITVSKDALELFNATKK